MTSEDVVEELALLRAAEMALKEGRLGVIVMKRMDQPVIIATTYYGTTLREDPGGFRTQLDVALNHSADQAVGAPEANWRILDAREVYRTLAAVYIAPKRRLKGYE